MFNSFAFNGTILRKLLDGLDCCVGNQKVPNALYRFSPSAKQADY